jgi:hypothetical protein
MQTTPDPFRQARCVRDYESIYQISSMSIDAAFLRFILARNVAAILRHTPEEKTLWNLGVYVIEETLVITESQCLLNDTTRSVPEAPSCRVAHVSRT